jgi:hypothetical protein
MTTERKLDEVLAELGREYRAIGAPETLELQLRAAATSRKSAVGASRVQAQWIWAAAAILLLTAATAEVLWQARKNHALQNQQVRTQPTRQARPEQLPSSPNVAARQTVVQKTVPARKPAPGETGVQVASKEQATWNSLDEFVPLPASEGLPPAAELSIVRIKLRGSDLQQYGLQAPVDGTAQTMLAEFVVGEDGLPRAIRIVR